MLTQLTVDVGMLGDFYCPTDFYLYVITRLGQMYCRRWALSSSCSVTADFVIILDQKHPLLFNWISFYWTINVHWFTRTKNILKFICILKDYFVFLTEVYMTYFRQRCEDSFNLMLPLNFADSIGNLTNESDYILPYYLPEEKD